jgi:hypothetical protein
VALIEEAHLEGDLAARAPRGEQGAPTEYPKQSAMKDLCRPRSCCSPRKMRLLSHESEDEELRGRFREACESFALVRSLAAAAQRQSRRVSELARLLGKPSAPETIVP